MNAPILPRPVLTQPACGERGHIGKSVALSLLAHVLFGLFVCGAAYWFSALTLKTSFAVTSSRLATGPASEQMATMEFLAAAPKPPPLLPPLQTPSPRPTIVQQAPKPANGPPRSVDHPKTLAKTTNKPRPKYTAANASGAGLTPRIASAHAGLPGLPRPDYPPEALYRREGGTVIIRVVFGPNGVVQSANVLQTSGFAILDDYTRAFIHTHWKNASLANTTQDAPIIYDPGKIVTADTP